ncbi:hypothetical protein RB594_009242 [Gaeumannomyces avenae]
MSKIRCQWAICFLLGLGLCAAIDQRPRDDFGSSCDPRSIKVDGRYATAVCRTILGDLRCSRVDLTECIKNSYGSLQADPKESGPSFFQECFNCSNKPQTGGLATGAPTFLHCQCDPKTGAPRSNWPAAVMDINTVIDNIDGILQCNGRHGMLWHGC